MDYTVMLNDKENEIVGLNKKIEKLHSRLEGQNRKENELKQEIKRLSDALEKINNPNISREQIADILVLNHEAAER